MNDLTSEITIEHSALHRETWEFRLSTEGTGRILLERYNKQERKSKRHKFRVYQHYSRMSHHRHANTVSAPEIPQNIRDMVIADLQAQILRMPFKLSY